MNRVGLCMLVGVGAGLWTGSWTPARGADWPHFLGPTCDGVSTETGILKDWPTDGPPVLWQRDTGKTYAAPSIAGGKLLLFHRIGDDIFLESLDAGTGKLLWKFTYPTDYVDRYGYNGGPRASPTLFDGRAYIFGPMGVLHCLDLQTGKPIWKKDIKSEFNVPDNFFGVGSSPVIEADRLLIAAGGPDGAGLIALDRKTGALLWKAGNQEASYSTPYAATLLGKRRVLHFGREGLVCVEAETGTLNWFFPFRARVHESVNAAGPIVSGDLIFISASYRTGAALLRMKQDGYEVVYKTQAMGTHWATSILDDGYLYGFDGRQESNTVLKCIAFKTGKPRWSMRGFGRGSLLKVDGQYVILGERGTLALAKLTPETATVLHHKKYLRYPCWIAPVLADGRLYIRNETRLLCLDFNAKP